MFFPHAAFEICSLYFERITLEVSFGESVYFLQAYLSLLLLLSLLINQKLY